MIEQAVLGLHEVDETRLERVDVLELVDEEMAEAPAHDVAERRVPADEVDDAGEQVVEVEHAAATLQRLVPLDHHGEHVRVQRAAAPLLAGRRAGGR